MFYRIKTFISLPLIEKKILAEVILVSLYVRILLLMFSFEFIEKKLIEKKYNKKENTNFKETILLIKKSIQRSSKLIFWRYFCLEQSLTALIMLRKRKLPFTLYLGVLKKNDKMLAHVWICSQTIYIVEKTNEEFSVIKEYNV